MEIPRKFIDYVFTKRVAALRALMRGETPRERVLIEFTRTLPAVITDGPAGLSGSIKMVSILPRQDVLPRVLDRLRELEGYSSERIFEVLVHEVYREDVLDFSRLGALELAKKHTWTNIRATKRATLLFFTPPIESYEVRCSVEIHEGDEVAQYLNYLHKLVHRAKRVDYPAYVFIIEEIYDNSDSPDGYGRLIYRRLA